MQTNDTAKNCPWKNLSRKKNDPEKKMIPEKWSRKKNGPEAETGKNGPIRVTDSVETLAPLCGRTLSCSRGTRGTIQLRFREEITASSGKSCTILRACKRPRTTRLDKIHGNSRAEFRLPRIALHAQQRSAKHLTSVVCPTTEQS